MDYATFHRLYLRAVRGTDPTVGFVPLTNRSKFKILYIQIKGYCGEGSGPFTAFTFEEVNVYLAPTLKTYVYHGEPYFPHSPCHPFSAAPTERHRYHPSPFESPFPATP